MKKSNVAKLFNTIKSGMCKRSPEILIGFGIAGMITTTVLAVKATPKALMLIEDAQYEKEEVLTTAEKVKAVWKCYVPAAVTGTASIACIIGANSVNAKRNAAIATAYKLSEAAFVEYKDKVIEEIGNQKEKVIREKVAQKKVDDKPVAKSEVIITGGGDVLFLEPVSMRYFKSDIESVRKMVNDLNFRLTTGMEEYISLSEFYDEIGLSHTSTSDDLGWNIYRDGQISINFPAAKTDKGEPCLVLDYSVSPRYDYVKLF